MSEMRCESARPHKGVWNPAERTAPTRERARSRRSPSIIAMYAPTEASSVTSRSKLALVSTLKFSALIRSRSCRIWVLSTSTIATTLSNLWKGMGMVGVLILVRDVRTELRAVSSVEAIAAVVLSVVISATCSERVGNVHHPVRKSARPVVSLLHCFVRICKCAHEAQREVFVELPVSVGVKFEGSIGRCSTRSKRARLVNMEPVAHHAPSQLWRGRHVDARLVRDII